PAAGRFCAALLHGAARRLGGGELGRRAARGARRRRRRQRARHLPRPLLHAAARVAAQRHRLHALAGLGGARPRARVCRLRGGARLAGGALLPARGQAVPAPGARHGHARRRLRPAGAVGAQMRPLFVTGSLVHGGAERHTIPLANRLAERGHDCHVVYVKNDPSQLERLRGAASVRCLHARRYFDFARVREFAAHVAALRPSVVLAANPYALMYSSLALYGAGVPAPLAVTFHTTLAQGAKEQLKMLYYRLFFWNADCAVFVSERQRRHWRRRQVFARRNEVIHNGVDLEQWKPLSAEARAALRNVLGFKETDLVVAMCAVLRPEKNPVQLVDALALARSR